MNTLLEKAISGAVSGFVAAALVDFSAFQRDPKLIKTFDWKLAIGRWAAGLLSGALAGMGLGQVSA